MVYPSTIPGNVPFAINVKFANLCDLHFDGTGPDDHANDFQFPQEVNLFSAGTLGRQLRFLRRADVRRDTRRGTGSSIEHARFDSKSLFGPPHLFNFRIGMFAPDLDDGFQEMWMMTDHGIDPIFAYDPVGFHGEPDSRKTTALLPSSVKAIEMYGVA